MVVVEGGTVEHRQLLESVLAGLGECGIRHVALEKWIERAVPGDLPTPEQARAASGISLRLLEPNPSTLRVDWEMRLVGPAVRERAAAEAIEQVVMLRLPSSSGTLQSVKASPSPLAPDEVKTMQTAVESAAEANGGRVEAFDVLQPLGHAWAAQIRVAEPHRFLRHDFAGFTAAVSSWRERCGNQTYIEIRDNDAQSCFTLASWLGGGASRVRRDVGCCDPLVHIGTPLLAAAPRSCPVFG